MDLAAVSMGCHPMILKRTFDRLSLRIKMLVVTIAVFVPAMLGGTGYFFYEAYGLTVNTSLNGLMNFVDAKQQGVIRFLGQNRKLAAQLGALADQASETTLRAQFATIVASDVFDIENHPFRDEIASGKRVIPTMTTYHAIELVRDGVVRVSSDPRREGRPWTQALNLAPGYSSVWEDGGVPVISFAAKTRDGMLYVHADARMLTNIVSGEIGNLEGSTGAFYLAGVGRTFDYYIVDENNRLITESRTRPNQLLKGRGSEHPWLVTQQRAEIVCGADGTYRTNANCVTGCRETMGFYEGVNGQRVIGASMPFYDSGWTIVVEQDAAELLTPLWGMLGVLTVVGTLLVLLAVILFGWLSRRLITGPLSGLSAAIRGMTCEGGAGSEFDLTRRYHDGRGDEVGELAKSFDGLVESLARVVHDIRRNNDHLAERVAELGCTSESVSQSSHQQAGAVAEIAAAMERVKGSADVVADLSEQSRQASSGDLDKAIEGERVTREASHEIGQVSVSVAAASKAVEALDERSKEIFSIVNVIREIAEQTNLLALNAAIEAARAGEQGRGFAVVADEVRKLAERTSNSTSSISRLIEATSDEVRAAVGVMEKTREGVERSTQLMSRVDAAFADISTGTRLMAEQVGGISSAAGQQRTTVADVAGLLNQVAVTAQQNKLAMEDTIALVHRIDAMAKDLSASVSHFGV
jgi:methyl-accepting chemotaxis protein